MKSLGKEGKVGYTPGPWTGSIGTGIRTQGSVLIADMNIHLTGNMSAEEQEANASLIATAPSMLEALKKADAMLSHVGCIQSCDNGAIPDSEGCHQCQWCAEYQDIKKAISQATNQERST